MTESPGNIDIISDLRKGDTRVLDHLFDQYYTALCYFAQGITHDKEEAKDIALESFTKLWTRKENFETPAAIKAFLYISTRNACFDFLRRQRRTTLQNSETDMMHITDEAEAERLQTEAELLRKIYAEVQNLPGKCKDVSILTWFEGLNTKQISERLNISVSNVTSQRLRAIQLLKNVLSDRDLLIFLLLVSAF